MTTLDLAALPDLLDLDDDALLDHLEAVADDLRATEERVKVLRARRIAIYENARERTPRITHAAVAARAKVSDAAVIQALARADEARAKAS